MSLRLAVFALAATSAFCAYAEEEVLTTAGAAQPLPAVVSAEAPARIAATATPREQQRAQEIGDWAQGVLDGRAPEPTDDANRPPRCPPGDGRPHGAVWGEVGTGGYRSVGGVVTQPIGECGSLTVGVSKAEGGRRHIRPHPR